MEQAINRLDKDPPSHCKASYDTQSYVYWTDIRQKVDVSCLELSRNMQKTVLNMHQVGYVLG